MLFTCQKKPEGELCELWIGSYENQRHCLSLWSRSCLLGDNLLCLNNAHWQNIALASFPVSLFSFLLSYWSLLCYVVSASSHSLLPQHTICLPDPDRGSNTHSPSIVYKRCELLVEGRFTSCHLSLCQQEPASFRQNWIAVGSRHLHL